MEYFNQQLHELELKLEYAKFFHPAKVPYYQALIIDLKKKISRQ